MRLPDLEYWYKFFKRLYEVTSGTDLFGRAAQSAFYLSFAIFPLLIFLVSVFGLILDSTDGFKAETYSYLNRIMPWAASELIRHTIDEIAANSSGSKLTIGLIATIWSASAGVDGIRSALNTVYGLRDRRSWWLTKLQSLGLTLLVTLIVGVVLTIVFYGWQLVQLVTGKLGYPIVSPFVLILIQWVSILALMLFACEVIYNLLPDFRKIRWRWVTPGSIVAIVLWIILTSSFRLYISFFNSYDKAYGSLGAVIVLMLWLYLTALVVMFGGAINTVAHELEGLNDDPDALIDQSEGS
ncbi:MAG: YihY/virulence factor BrkB family protein [Acidobacteriota bacterium]